MKLRIKFKAWIFRLFNLAGIEKELELLEEERIQDLRFGIQLINDACNSLETKKLLKEIASNENQFDLNAELYNYIRDREEDYNT